MNRIFITVLSLSLLQPLVAMEKNQKRHKVDSESLTESVNIDALANQLFDAVMKRDEKFIAAAKEGNYYKIDAYLKVFPFLKKQLALHYAIHHGNIEIVILLLENGAQAHYQTEKGQTPLMIAAYRGNLTICEILLNRGARIESTDNKGNTAFDWLQAGILQASINERGEQFGNHSEVIAKLSSLKK